MTHRSSSWGRGTWFRIFGLVIILFALMSLNYLGATFSASLSLPIALILAALADTLVLSYFVINSRFQGFKEWSAVFSILYVGNYVLTAMESVYLSSILTPYLVLSILINGVIVSGIFALALVRFLSNRQAPSQIIPRRLVMPKKEWAWKIICSGAVYLFLFILVGLAVYAPIAKLIDPVAYASEQTSIPTSAAGLVFPLEFLRGIVWTALAILVTISLPFGWKKTALIAGLLLAVPISMSIFLSTAIAPGLQIAHFAELFVENLIFGIVAVWIIHLRSKFITLAPEEHGRASPRLTTQI